MKARATFLLSLLISSVPALGQLEDNIPGVYQCKGVDTTGAEYSGTAKIDRHNETYTVLWTLGGTKYTGIGIKMGDVLAVSYYGKMSGVIAYQITGDRLSGTWAIAASNGKAGVETLIKTQ